MPPNVLPDWRSGIERARSRTNHLIGKLQSLNHSSNRVLFIRLFDDVSNQALFGTRLTPPQATERLVAALRSRFDKISFDLMCVSFEHRLEKPDPSIIYVDICDPATCWQGTDSLWDQAFDQIHARLEPPEASIAS